MNIFMFHCQTTSAFDQNAQTPLRVICKISNISKFWVLEHLPSEFQIRSCDLYLRDSICSPLHISPSTHILTCPESHNLKIWNIRYLMQLILLSIREPLPRAWTVPRQWALNPSQEPYLHSPTLNEKIRRGEYQNKLPLFFFPSAPPSYSKERVSSYRK